MTKQTISKFVSVSALGLLVFVFGLILLVVVAPLFVPKTGGFVLRSAGALSPLRSWSL
jgi:hypothetical protein